MSKSNDLALALSLILGSFALVSIGIIAYFLRKYYRRRFVVSAYFRHRDSDSDISISSQFNTALALDSHLLMVIEAGRKLLKSSKQMTDRCAAIALGEMNSQQMTELNIMSTLESIRDSVDRLATALYESKDADRVLHEATGLVRDVDAFVLVTRQSASASKLSWQPRLSEQILADFRALCEKVVDFRTIQQQLSSEL